MKIIFIDRQNNYRVGWKIIFAIIISVVASSLSVIIASLLYQNIRFTSFSSMINNTMDTNWGHALNSVILIFLLYFGFHVISKGRTNYWEQLGFTDFKPVTMAIIGFLFAALFCSLYIIPLYLTNQLKIEFAPFTPNAAATLVAGLIIYAGVAFSEELIFRGYSKLFEREV